MSRKEYKTIRVYSDDAQRFKRLSYRTGKPIVRLISEALKLLQKQYSEYSKENNDSTIIKKEYRTVRIYPDDTKKFKKLSFETDKPIVQLVSTALNLLEKKHKQKIKESKRYEI